MKRSYSQWVVLLCCIASSLLFSHCTTSDANGQHSLQDTTANPGKDTTKTAANTPAPAATTLDTAAYNQKMMKLVNGDSSGRWPAKTPYPLAGAILPFKRVIAYYG